MCLFWWLYGFLWWVFAIEKLEYSRYNAKKIMNWFDTILIVVVFFLILTDLTKVLLSFVWLKFSSFGLSYDGWRKDVKSLSLGMPWHPKLLSKNEQPTKLGDAPEWHPRFLPTTICILLEAIFLFVTWYVFCLERLVWYESLLVLFCVLSHQSLMDTPIWESQNYVMTC